MRILLVEDDLGVTKLLTRALTSQNYAVDIVTDGEAGWVYGSTFNYDLIILDWMLPKLDGIGLCRRLREEGFNTPILLLTARDTNPDKIHALDAGADDYLIKPVEVEELNARIRALLRRSSANNTPILSWGQLQLNPSTSEVTYANQLLTLTNKEYAFLELFLRNSHHVFSISAILDNVWASEEFPAEATVRSHIRRLRQKLQNAGAPANFIETVHGRGYTLRSQNEDTHPKKEPPFPGRLDSTNPQGDLSTSLSAQQQQQLYQTFLAETWQQYRPMAMQHLGILHQAMRALQNGVLSPSLRQQAEMSSHSLTGTLGMLGLQTASQTSKALELLLSKDESSPLADPDQADQTRISDKSLTLGHQIEALILELQQAIQSLSLSSTALIPAQQNHSPLILIVDPDPGFTQPLVERAASHNIRAAVATSLDMARTWLYPNPASHPQTKPELVLLRLPDSANPTLLRQGNLPLETEEAWLILEELAHQKQPLPILAITDQTNWRNRLQAIRKGGYIHILDSPDPDYMMAIISQLLAEKPPQGAKIMVVEDDPFWLQTLPNMLEPWGFQLSLVPDPQYFWESLKSHTPDLLILDIKMPHINGFELCKVLRSDPQWTHLPVLFLSALSDAQNQIEAFTLGADDFISKPVNAETLAMRIRNRLTRAKSCMHKYCTANTAI